MPTLQVLLGGRLVTSVELDGGDLRLGRAAENDVVLENDGSSVSRFHAELRRTGEGYQLVNLSQHFGLEVGGRRVERAPLGETPVRIGPYELTLVRAEAGAGAADGPAAVRRERPSQAVTLRIPRPAPFVPVPATGSPTPPPRAGETPAPAAEGDVRPVAPPPAALTPAPTPPSRVGAAGPLRSRRLAGWLTLAAFAAGLVAIVAIGQLIAPTAVSQPEPVAATAPEAPPAGAPADSAASAVTLHLAAAREALARGRYDEVLDPHVAAILGEAPAHAEALSLKQEAEAALARAREAATAQAEATRAAATATPAAPEAAAAGGGRRPILRKPGGPQTSFPGRDRDVVRRYLQAMEAAKSGEYRLAVSNLNSVLRSDPTFPGAEEQLEEVKGRVRKMAEDKFAEATRLEGDGQYRAALTAYQRSKEIAVMMYGDMVGADEAMARVRGAMAAAGVDAFKRARQFDALGRSGEAVPMYTRALELLPDDDPNRQVAQDRLAALRKQ